VNEPKIVIPILIIVNACMWGFTLIMVARALSGTGMYQEIQHILSAMAGISTVIIGGGMGSVLVMMKKQEKSETTTA